MKSIYILVLLLISLFATSGTAQAAIDVPTFQPQLPAFKPFDQNKLYSVSITCEPRGGDLMPISERTTVFTKEKYTTTHAVFVSTKTATQLADATAKLPEGALGMALVYVTDGEKGTEIDNRSACDQTFLVKQTNTLFLIPALNFSKTVKPGPLFAAIGPIMDIITPLTSVFLGVPIPADIIKKVTSIQQTEDPFGKLLTLFNKNRSFARSYKLSAVGTTYIDTQFSRVKVTVKPVPAIVDVPQYLSELKRQIDAAPEKIQSANIQSSCVSIVNALARMGFVSLKDQVFALTYTALKSFTNKNDILECLGKKRAEQAVALGDILWSGVADETKITKADVETQPDGDQINLPQQPSFTSIRGTMNRLMVYMGRYAQNSPPPPDSSSALSKLLATNVSITNMTISGATLPGDAPTGFPALIDHLMTRGYYHFGCFKENTDETGQFANNTSVVFLGFRAAPREKKTTIGNTLAFFPFFSGGAISNLVASDNIDWIRGVLKDRDKTFDCNGFQVDEH